MNVTIVANKITWDFESNLPKLIEWFKTYSRNKLDVTFDIKRTSFDTVPLSTFQDRTAVDVTWYRQNVTPLATGQITVFLLNPDQYQNNYGVWGFMTWGDEGKAVRCEVSSYDEPNFPEAPLFVHRTFHEIAHALFFLTGQTDRVHELLFQDPPKRQELMDLIDYPKLQAKLLTINSMNSYVKTINLDGEIAGYVPLRTPSDIELFNKIFNVNLAPLPDGNIPTDIKATKY